MNKFLLLLLVSVAVFATAEEPPFDPDTEHRQIVEGVAHPDYCKDKNGEMISGSECIKKSVEEIHGKSNNESESIAESIEKSLENKKNPKLEERQNRDSVVEQK